MFMPTRGGRLVNADSVPFEENQQRRRSGPYLGNPRTCRELPWRRRVVAIFTSPAANLVLADMAIEIEPYFVDQAGGT